MKWPVLVFSVLCCLGSFFRLCRRAGRGERRSTRQSGWKHWTTITLRRAVRMIRLQPFCKIFLPRRRAFRETIISELKRS